MGGAIFSFQRPTAEEMDFRGAIALVGPVGRVYNDGNCIVQY